MQHFDYVVIGGGSGGYAAARTAREVCDQVAIIDGAKELGGLCILRGCMPSKTLIYSAEILHLAQKGRQFGLDLQSAEVDMPLLHQRKLDIIKEFSDYRQEQLESDRFTLFRNNAHFISENCIELDNGEQITADHFMVATGSAVAVPPIVGLGEVPFWTSDHILDLDFLPSKIIVLGGGIVACELTQFLRRIGSEVIQIQRSSSLLKELPESAAAVVAQAFKDEGIDVYTDTAIESVSHTDGIFTVQFKHANQSIQVTAPYLLNALGRVPASDQLNLPAAGIECRPSGHIRCNEYQQTTNSKVYACGDVAGPHEIVHIAIMQGEVAARHATNRSAEPVDYETLSSVVFTDPQVAQVGKTETQLQAEGLDFLVADYPFDDHGKSILMEAKYGYVKVIADKAGTVLGAECVSKDAGELIHTMAVAVSLKANVRDLLKVHWYHPTLAEIWTYPIEDIVDEL
ncbi:dihydrolipoyl dehydrogenase family protein [Coraliomargarita akajimensis]|uniref:FAD-dependent pyridine nucleotide-disulfide oxidoreductase n=1 Tax=Coraliomargarita akajimensis (strain DSM 45221 / IAM 15411 / JCM 23193 / KCTC 12865 / 04OKA010-24) TaxID=583355 RepID=D5EPG1_CORAD|nr:NAD(P)/FAD-dependent oxidoreductase [Coraliomargarita akajimensis]ADE53698.1 FAD-dependent pyridine nucleotide-disulfide oxidoreductase [Coraliomargarita akajimensis DSM 45221]